MLFRLGFIALNIYGAKKTLDLISENRELKQENMEQTTTLNTLAKYLNKLGVKPQETPDDTPEYPEEVQADGVRDRVA
jgi:hypothetical protein